LLPSFVIGDPWTTVATGTVPFWTFFSVRPALEAFACHLEDSEPYRQVDILQFQHGVRSAGIAAPDEWLAVARRYAATAELTGVDPRRFPHDIATLARYGPRLDALPAASHPWSPLAVGTAVERLSAHPELSVGVERVAR
jgi:hypothetical protein